MILKILKFIFLTLGIIFFIIIVGVTIFIIKDPLNLRFLFSDFNMVDFNIQNIQEMSTERITNELTPARIECFISTLGEQRAQEIANGAVPGPGDFLKAKNCLK